MFPCIQNLVASSAASACEWGLDGALSLEFPSFQWGIYTHVDASLFSALQACNSTLLCSAAELHPQPRTFLNFAVTGHLISCL